jgi:hypothetical protein
MIFSETNLTQPEAAEKSAFLTIMPKYQKKELSILPNMHTLKHS